MAGAVADLIWAFVGVCAAIWALVMIALAVAALRRVGPRPDPLDTDIGRERRIGSIIAGCVGATAVIVIALTLLSYFAQRILYAQEPGALTLQVTGHQWWWQVQYQGPRPERSFQTANEIHVPVGEPVSVVLKTADVIHSFWVPSLAGKMDQITGQQNELRFKAARSGVYHGQCAEFCGQEHAKMAFVVVASPPNEFNIWREAQLKPAAMPSDAVRERGLQAFFTVGCMLCHTIRGTDAGGKLGPDLTHLGSRRTIVGGTLPNTPGNLGAWIADPQHVKPGALMPAMPLAGDQLNSLVSYLTGLK